MTRQPAPILLTRAPVHSDEWFAAREKGIGGSEIASVLGLGRFQSAYALWWRKRGDIPPDPGNPRTDRGTILEPALLAELARRHDHLHWKATPNLIYQHAWYPWQRASADSLGYLTRHARRPLVIGEAKTAGDGWLWGPDGTDEIPIDYRCQVIWTMDVHAAAAALVIMDDGQRIREYEIPAEPDTAAYMRDRAKYFLDSLKGGAPPVDASDSTYQVLRQLHPEIEDRDHDTSTAVAVEFAAATLALRAADERASLAKNVLANEMGMARRAVVPGGKRPRAVATRQDKSRGTGGPPSVVAGQSRILASVLEDLGPATRHTPARDLDPLDQDAAAEILAAFRSLPAIPTGVPA
jgi:putative phage-type endonuclease